MKILGCASCYTRSAPESAATAPTLTMPATRFVPMDETRRDGIGDAAVGGVREDARDDRADPDVDRREMARLPRIPRGRSPPGLRVSSAVVETASKPMNAKKMIAAPAWMPLRPFGENGM